jgi:hypothetical protein
VSSTGKAAISMTALRYHTNRHDDENVRRSVSSPTTAGSTIISSSADTSSLPVNTAPLATPLSTLGAMWLGLRLSRELLTVFELSISYRHQPDNARSSIRDVKIVVRLKVSTAPQQLTCQRHPERERVTLFQTATFSPGPSDAVCARTVRRLRLGSL